MIQPIIDEASHEKALRRAEQLWDAEPGSAAERELDALATLIDVYEQRRFPIDALGPIDAIKTRCEYLGWTRRELEPLIGSRARVSEVLSGKRPLTLAMIRRPHEALDMPAEILIAEELPSASRRPLARAKKRARSTRSAAELGVAADGSRFALPQGPQLNASRSADGDSTCQARPRLRTHRGVSPDLR